jgi:hypothetical protein
MEVEMSNLTCGTCGILFGITKSWENGLRSSHQDFYCPNGHKVKYSDPTAREKELQALKDELKTTKEELMRVQKKLAALDAYYSRMENRLVENPAMSIALVLKEVAE